MVNTSTNKNGLLMDVLMQVSRDDRVDVLRVQQRKYSRDNMTMSVVFYDLTTLVVFEATYDQIDYSGDNPLLVLDREPWAYRSAIEHSAKKA